MKNFTLSLFCFLAIGVSFSYGQFSKVYDFTVENDLQNSNYSQPVFDGTWLYDVSSDGGISGLGCIYKVKVDGTEYTKLLDFIGITNGSNPYGSLTLSGSILYGMTNGGGSNNLGTIFKISTDGTGYNKLLDFDGGTSIGSFPHGSLTLSGTVLFGVSNGGGAYNLGTIFRINTDGSGFTKLLDFDGTTNGNNFYGSLAISGSVLFGMNASGGANDMGTIFKINLDGTGYAKILDFAGASNGSSPVGSLTVIGSIIYGMTTHGGTYNNGTIFKINSDGSGYTKLLDFDGITNGINPQGSLTISGSVLYGMTWGGGTNNLGTIFKINTDGTNYGKLLDFDGTAQGSLPRGSLTISGSVLYGTTDKGGLSNKGAMFKINTDGSSFTKILDYSKAPSGCAPLGSLAISGSEMYGMTSYGGTYGLGTIFKINVDGTGFTKMLDFDGTTNGLVPEGSLALSGSVLYGMTSRGGTNDKGTIFKINTDGSGGYSKMLDFDGTIHGSQPNGCSLTILNSVIYGVTSYGGVNNKGTIFKINTDGTGFTKLLDFEGATNGSIPHGSLTISGSVLYGMTIWGGSNNLGTIYKLNTDGTGFSKLLDLNGTTNGKNPYGSLTLSGSVLYGMVDYGGTKTNGVLFKINTDGTGYVKLLDFDYNANGSIPTGSLTINGSVLYGFTVIGGTYGKGTFFKINTDGTGFAKLQDFNGSNGKNPWLSAVTLNSNTLYGMTPSGGAMLAGLIFRYDICTPPTTQASNFTSSGITDNSMTVSWTRGDGAGVLVIAHKGSAVDAIPIDGVEYNANAVFGNGSQIGTGNYVVYNGTGSSVNITDLNSGTGYYYAVYEYCPTNWYKTPALTGNETTIPEVTIHNIQYTTDASGDSPYATQKIKTSGIITGIRLSTLGVQQAIYIQDGTGPWSGLYVYGIPASPIVALGDKVIVTGTIIEYSKLTELSPTTNLFIESSGNTIASPIELSTHDANDESYESILIKVKNANCLSGAAGTYIVDDGTGSLTVYKGLYPSLALTPNNIYTITGFSSQYTTVWEIYPRDAADVLNSTAAVTSIVYTVNETTNEITNIPFNTTIAQFKANLLPSSDATFEVYQSDGITIASTMVTGNKVIVTAQDGVTKKTYNITLNVLSSAKDITSFNIGTYVGTIVGTNISVEVESAFDLNNLIATFTLSTGANATVSSVNQVSGTTANNFTNPVTYVITAEDASTKNYIVSVTKASAAVDLFFSEYVEGTTGNNKAFEIYNPTSAPIDLSGYTIKTSNNGAGFGNWAGPSGAPPYTGGGADIRYVITFAIGTMISAGDVYVIANAQADAGGLILATADYTVTYSGVINTGQGANVCSFNGNDAFALYKGVTMIDVIGNETLTGTVTSSDPAFDVAGTGGATRDHSIVRKSTVHSGNINWATSAGTDAATSEWIVYTADDFTHLGTHTMDPVANSPTITVSTDNISSFGSVILNTSSNEKSFTVIGAGLTNDITITAPIGFEISTNAGITFAQQSPITLSSSVGSVPETSIYVKFHPTSAQAYSGNITITSTGATDKAVAVAGTGIGTSCTPPSIQSSNCTSSNITNNSLTVNWTRGNGTGVLVIVHQGSIVDASPVDGTLYTADVAFGNGSQIGTGNYVVYNGSGTSINLTNLNSGTYYYYAIYEYSTTNCYKTPALIGNAMTLGLTNFTNFQEANIVVGQLNFTAQSTIADQNTTPYACASAVSTKGVLAIATQPDGRVLIWNKVPTTNGTLADIIVGKLDFTSTVSGCSQSLIGICNGVCFSPDGNKLIVSDDGNNRVLIWNSTPTNNGQPADIVIGQTDFISGSSGCTANKFNHPAGAMVTPDGKLLINDLGNNRVLVFNKIPTINGASADLVIGQPDMISSGSGSGANQLYHAWCSAMSPDGKLLISDEYNHRALIFNRMPTSNNPTADLVIGQTGFNLNSEGSSASKLQYPVGISVSPDGKVAIGEYGNNRALIYNSLPLTNGTAADLVLGQPDFVSNTAFNGGVSNKSMNHVYGVNFDLNRRLFVNGRYMHRMMIFGNVPSQKAELEVSFSANTTDLCSGSSVQYIFRITNNGPDNASDVIAQSIIPFGFTQDGAIIASSGTYNSATGWWNIPSIPNGASQTLIFNGRIQPSITITAYANISSSEQEDINLSNNAASITVTSSANVAPIIVQQPTNQNVILNSSVVFSVSATGTSLGYQWQVNPSTGVFVNLTNGSTYSGVTSNSLNISSASISTNNYLYRCVITGSGPCIAISNAAFLLITDSCVAPTIGTITQPTCALATGSVLLNDLPTSGTWTLIRAPEGTTTTGTGASTTISGLVTGTYTYTVTNVSGCTSGASANVIINAQPLTPTAPTIGTITHPTIAVATGSVVLNDLPATGTWTLTRTPGAITNTGTGTSSTITRLATGTYTYTVTNSSGCTSGASANVLINAQPTSGINDGNLQATNYLGQNFPNPFDYSTTIEFSVVKPSHVTLSVFNTLGKEVDVIVNEFLTNGSYTRNWEPKNLPNGIYYYQLRIEGFKATRRLIIFK